MPEQPNYAPDEVNENGDYIKIGGSPVPGLTLQHILRGHTDTINRIAWSPDGAYLASPSHGSKIFIWDVRTGRCVRVLRGFGYNVDTFSMAWSPRDMRLAASSYGDIRLWHITASEYIPFDLLEWDAHDIYSIAWSPDGKHLASTSSKNTICLWDGNAISKKPLQTFIGHTGPVTSVAWSPDGKYIASVSFDKTIGLWNAANGNRLQTLQGHTSAVFSIAWSPDGKRIASASDDKTIRLWDLTNSKPLQVLEGHSEFIRCVTFSPDGRWLASKGESIRLWHCDTWACVAILDELASAHWYSNIVFHPHKPILATLGEGDRVIRIWELDEAVLLGASGKFSASRFNYTTAKLVLVGDSGVGKTGLGWRLAHGKFKEHASTHGQQFWSIPQLGLKRKDGTDCEAVLWDLAGQPIYRQVHSIFLENVTAALVLFDANNRQDPLKGVQFWLEQLKGKGGLPPTVLVGGRVDVSPPTLSLEEYNQFCQRYGVKGGYISTSAKKGDGVEELLEILKKQIPWDEMTATVTTVTFKKIKDYVLSLKEKTDRKGVLVNPQELRTQLEAADKDWQFSDAEMMTAVGHLETHGYVSVLHNSAGEQFILLTPDVLVNLAASIMLLADKNARELGAVSETELLQDKAPFDELKGLEKAEQQILIDAAIQRFLEHNVCFRETFNDDTLLIFPSLIKQKRPLQDDIPSTDDISYVVRGHVENLYASLVVLLGYTPSFTRINQWQNQAQYEMKEGELCGFRSIEEREGEIELVLYYGEKMPQGGRDKFQELFEQFLYQRDVEITRFPPVVCKNDHQQKRATVVERAKEGKTFVFCDECGEKIILPDFEKPQTIGIGVSPWLQREESMARLRSLYEKHLTNIKSYRRGWATPRVYLSHLPEQDELAKKLTHDLQDAGVYVIEKPKALKAEDFAIILDTLAYQKAFQASSSALANDVKVIRSRLSSTNKKLLSFACEGRHSQHNFMQCTPSEFFGKTHYLVSLFNLVMELYAIPLDHRGFEPLRQSLHEQWEQTISHSEHEIFISYSWGGEQEKIVNELDTEFQGHDVTIVRDKRDVGFKGSIKNFMKTIGHGKAVILVISEKYLKSPNCCFELVQIAKHGQFKDRIFPIVLNDANIYDPVDRLRYVKHWEDKKNELDDLMKTVSSANLDGFREDIDLYTEIRALLPRLMDVLKDMNTLTPDLHRTSGFSEIFDAVMAKLEE